MIKKIVDTYTFYINERNDAEKRRLLAAINTKIEEQEKEKAILIDSKEEIENLAKLWNKVRAWARKSGELETFLIEHQESFDAAIIQSITDLKFEISVESKIELEFKR